MYLRYVSPSPDFPLSRISEFKAYNESGRPYKIFP
jgi:hypothetical protein